MRHVVIVCAVACGLLCNATAAEQGLASYYGSPAGGMTAAHRSLPKGSEVRVHNLDNGRSADVRIVDRGPVVRGRVIDVSPKAADTLGFRGAGLAHVEIDPEKGTPGSAAPGAYAICEDAARRLQHLPGDPENGLQCENLRSEPFGLMAGASYPALSSRIDVASLEAPWSASAPAVAPGPDRSSPRRSPAPRRSPERPSASHPVPSFFARLRRLF